MAVAVCRIAIPVCGAALLAACQSMPVLRVPPVTHHVPMVEAAPAPPMVVPNPIYKVGNPYQVAGIWYYPKEQPDYDQTGIASWYGAYFHGMLTSNGEVFDRNGVTAAHPT